MNYLDYFNYSPSNENIHHFLKNLDDCPANTTDKQVAALAIQTLKIRYYSALMLNTPDKIFNSVRTLIPEWIETGSLVESQKEISGAINGLNILLKYEKNSDKQMKIQGMIQAVSEKSEELKSIFKLKEALANEPELKKLIQDPLFIENFERLTALYGKKRNIDPSLIQLFSRLWLNPSMRLFLQDFIKGAQQTRDINLDILKTGRLPLIEDKHNQTLFDKHSSLTQAVVQELEKQDFQNFKTFLDELFSNRTLVTNTQTHTDGLNLAFNSEATDTLSNRLRSSSLKGETDYQFLLQQAMPTTEEEIKKWQKLEHYHPRPVGFLYTKSVWEPTIGPEDRIQPIHRIIGFAAKEGIKKETQTRLDFTKALGEQNLNLTPDERQGLSELLKACDSEILTNPSAIDHWNKTREIPENIANVLKAFDSEARPHLQSLSSTQKEELVNEALCFAFEVNYHLADDLLNLLY